MEIGFKRFLEKPLGNGLAEAGPAYRSVHKDLPNTKEIEEFYIPESWFIQQLIEGGIIYFLLFVTIFSLILVRLYRASLVLFVVLSAILIMNLFLHIFEATYLTVLLAIFVGVGYKKSFER
jgi:hypothetical protein